MDKSIWDTQVRLQPKTLLFPASSVKLGNTTANSQREPRVSDCPSLYPLHTMIKPQAPPSPAYASLASQQASFLQVECTNAPTLLPHPLDPASFKSHPVPKHSYPPQPQWNFGIHATNSERGPRNEWRPTQPDTPVSRPSIPEQKPGSSSTCLSFSS